MSKKDKEAKRTIRLTVLEILRDGVDIEKPHDVDYHTNYECYTESKDGKSVPKEYGEEDQPAVIQFLDILTSSISSTILDEIKEAPMALHLAQALAKKLVGAVAQGFDVTLVTSMDELRDKMIEAGAPPHIIESAQERIRQEVDKREGAQASKHEAMRGLETAQLTKEQEASLALTLSSTAFLKHGKH